MVQEVAGSIPVIHPKISQSIDYQDIEESHFCPASVSDPLCVSYDLVPLLPNQDMYPFKKAHLNDCGGDLSKRWYIVFYAFDVQQQKLIRKRFYEVNDYPTEIDRRNYARRMIREINQLLKDGYHMDVNKAPSVAETQEQLAYTLTGAIELALEIKKAAVRPSSYPSYKSCVKIFNTWAQQSKISSMDILNFDRLRAVYFDDYLMVERSYNACTVNGHNSYLKSLFQLLVEREIIGQNPFKKIAKHKESASRRNLAYSKEQIETIKKIIKPKDPQLWLFIQFIYYCYLRPNEIRQLEHRYFNLEARKIFIPGSVSKNGKDGYVSIPENFYNMLNGSEVFNSRKQYVFHTKLEDKPFSKNVMTERFRKLIKPLNLGSDYTLYSWKHSGVVAAYNAGVDIKSIQNQCRHHSLEQTDVYLKSLGLGVSQAINQIPKL